MMRLFPLLCLVATLVSTVVAQPAAASPFERLLKEGVRVAGEAPERQNMVPDRRQTLPRIDSRQAAARVKQIFSDRKILGVKLIETRGPPVYRVQTLSEEGVVKYVFVDGTSGNVFE